MMLMLRADRRRDPFVSRATRYAALRVGAGRIEGSAQ